jgi:hypothetical protein
MRARPLCRAVMFYRFPEKVFIDTAKDLVGQLQRACLLAF